jgi:type II secretory pathway component PulF
MTIHGRLNPATLAVAFVLVIFGFFLVSKILAVKIRHRQENLDRSLPDIIDLFVISMEAGLSLNAALQRVSEEIQGVYRDFSDELQITAGELRAGIPWDEAFDNLGKRTDVQSIRSMVGLMIQSNKLGASIGDALRHHSDFHPHPDAYCWRKRRRPNSHKNDFPAHFLHHAGHSDRGRRARYSSTFGNFLESCFRGECFWGANEVKIWRLK